MQTPLLTPEQLPICKIGSLKNPKNLSAIWATEKATTQPQQRQSAYLGFSRMYVCYCYIPSTCFISLWARRFCICDRQGRAAGNTREAPPTLTQASKALIISHWPPPYNQSRHIGGTQSYVIEITCTETSSLNLNARKSSTMPNASLYKNNTLH